MSSDGWHLCLVSSITFILCVLQYTAVEEAPGAPEENVEHLGQGCCEAGKGASTSTLTLSLALYLSNDFAPPKHPPPQGLSANIIHLWNILASVLTTRGSFDFSAIPRVASLANSTNMTLFGPAKDGSEPAPTSDECELYLLTFALDTTVGLLITFYLMEVRGKEHGF